MNARRQGTTKVTVPNARLTPAAALRLGRLARELRITNQILSADLDAVDIVDGGPAPAWTTLDGDRITFALVQMPFPADRVSVAVWLGTNAHELGHVLFSPRRGSALMQRVIEAESIYLRGIVGLHNIVEDQRQERLLLARFAPWRAYLTAALGHHLKADHETAWLLFAGRTWLPASVRAEAKANFTARYGAASADTVAEIVGDYQRLTDPGDTEAQEAWELLGRLHDLFGTNVPQPPHRCTPMESGEPDADPDTTNAPAAADEDEDGAEEAEGGEGAPGEGNGQGEAQEGAGEAQEAAEGTEGASAGRGNRRARQAAMRSDILDAAADQLDNDEAAAVDIDNILDALRDGRAGDGADGAEPVGKSSAATAAAHALHREIGDALLELKDANEPGWERRTDSGRLNVRRLLNPHAEADTLFDRYAPGQMDANELELVLLLDVSGSMDTRLPALAEATWAIRHAVDDIDGTATVITWDDGAHRVLAATGQRPDARMFTPAAGGGTNPVNALTEAYRLIADSRCRNRLVVILTDGDWSNTTAQRAEEIIAAINAAGGVTVCALLGNRAGSNTHGCRHGAHIDNPSELARLFRRVAAAQMAGV